MIKLTKISGEEILINEDRIEHVEAIPESKIMMASGNFYLVNETLEELIDIVAMTKAKILLFKDKMEINKEQIQHKDDIIV